MLGLLSAELTGLLAPSSLSRVIGAVFVVAISIEHVEEMDRMLQAFRDAGGVEPPNHGWLRAIRTALGMSVDQLATRVGMSAANLADLEEAEAAGHAPLGELERVASSLGCRLVYGLVPQQTLKTLVEEQVRKVAEKRVGYMEQLLRQHGHALSAKEIGHHVEEFSRIILNHLPGSLWDHLVDDPQPFPDAGT